MFTGLVEETGKIASLKKADSSLYITVQCSKVLDGLKIGDSIAINGACQTVIEFTQDSFTVFASCETLSVTTFSSFKEGRIVNLERTLRLCDRLDGHLVSGHVDGTAIITKIVKSGDTTEFTLDVPSELVSQMVKKGSVTVDGISLTIAAINNKDITIAVIPHTLKSTNLAYLKVNDRVNIETDMIGKYVEKYLLSNDNINKTSNISIDLLERNGFV